MSDAKITVIIPVYKVEKYLRKCVDSVLAQTYTNLEVILVDDGSPDNCPAICDDYAARDERIRVIHQRNAGVSAARNAGLDAATGDYIGFVDSDDWIEPDMYETLEKTAEENGVDISYVSYAVDRGTMSKKAACEGKTVIYDAEKMLAAIFEGKHLCGMVSLYIAKISLFDGVRFATDISISEDLLVAVQLVLQTEYIAYSPYCGYHYVMHDGAAHNSTKSSFWSCFSAYNRIEKILRKNKPDLLDSFFTHTLRKDLLNAATATVHGQLNFASYRVLRKHATACRVRKSWRGLPAKWKAMFIVFLLGLYPFKICVRLLKLVGIFQAV